MATFNVLLVDDNVIFLRILENFVKENWGAELQIVGTAKDGEEALKQAADLKPQIVFLDLAMPKLSGLKTIGKLKAMLPPVHVIILTLLDSMQYKQAALDAGADYFIAKENLETELGTVFAKIFAK